jgi:hypothetical protein
MISGAGNFPVRKKEKQVAAWDNLRKTYDYVKDILEQIQSIGYGKTIIKSNDTNAIELLQSKVDTLTANQTKMKLANAHYRKHKTMKGFDGISDEEAEKQDTEIKNGYSWCQCPYPSYELTNNNAAIKQAQTRLDDLIAKKEKAATQEVPAQVEYSGFKVVENLEMDRLQIIFDGKPEENIRTALKSNGFRWAPSVNAWQRQLTANAKYSLKRVLEVIQ